MKILAIETSCDDTGIAILEYKPQKNQLKILANLVSSQIKIHAPWGGVVPMLAKREHQKNLVPLLIKALKKSMLLTHNCHPGAARRQKDLAQMDGPAYARSDESETRRAGDSSPRHSGAQNDKRKIKTLNGILAREPELAEQLLPFLQKYQKPDTDYIAVTVGPGLEPALWVGVNFVRALAYFWKLPILPINHIEGHIAAAFAAGGESRGIFNFPRPCLGSAEGGQFSIFNKSINLPAITLVVSGGHTQLILVKKIGDYKIVGETRDDAAGEAFDKVAKMLNLGYPGGPALAAEAAKLKIKNEKLKVKELPRPMINSNDFDFSFSGLKTAVLYALQKMTPAQIKKFTPAIAAEFQQAVIDVLIAKTIRAAKEFDAKTVLLSGGVAANDLLRNSLSLATNHLSLNFSVPPKNLCVDNAVMIALTAAQKIAAGEKIKTARWQNLQAQANLRIG